VSSIGCMVPQPFVTSGNRSYLDFWVVTGNPRYLGYKTPTCLFSNDHQCSANSTGRGMEEHTVEVLSVEEVIMVHR
jgi:hypothetical protein